MTSRHFRAEGHRHPRMRYFFRGVARTAVALLLWPCVIHAQQARPLDYEVKATYLFNFGRFTTWPLTTVAAEGNLFSVCVLGHDPFGPALEATLAGERITGKPIVARRIAKSSDAVGCRI